MLDGPPINLGRMGVGIAPYIVCWLAAIDEHPLSAVDVSCCSYCRRRTFGEDHGSQQYFSAVDRAEEPVHALGQLPAAEEIIEKLHPRGDQFDRHVFFAFLFVVTDELLFD